MRHVVNTTNNAELENLIGKNVMIFCMSYIYTGKLVASNDRHILLENPAIVYETGEFTSKTFKDAQALPFNHFICRSSVESFGETNKK